MPNSTISTDTQHNNALDVLNDESQDWLYRILASAEIQHRASEGVANGKT